MNGQLRNKVVLVTGSSQGIGRATALRFAEEGCRVVITYHRDDRGAEEASERCLRLGAPRTMVLQLDVTDDYSIARAVGTAVDELGAIDVLVNNAGVLVRKRLEEQSPEEIEVQVRTNLEGTIKMTRACLPHLREAVINVTSLTALRGYPSLGTYAASKAGIIAFTRTLADEIGPRRAYNVFPNATATRMTNFHGDPPEEVAEAIVRLARGDYAVPNGGDVKVGDLPIAKGYGEALAAHAGPAR